MKYLVNLDLLKKKINLNSIDSEKYSTKLGVMLSIFLYVVAIYLVVYYFKKITDKELQSIVMSNRILDKSPNITLTGFVPYIVRFEGDNQTLFNNESVVDLSANYILCKGKTNCYFMELNLTKCKLNTFPQKYENILRANKFDNAYCINFEDNPKLNGSLTLLGSWSENETYSLAFYGKICFNKSSCLNSNDLNNFLYSNPTYFSFYSLEDNLNPQNYSVPELNYGKSTYLQVINNMYKAYYNYLTISNISSDIGLINEQNNYTQIYSNEIKLQDINYFGASYINSEAQVIGHFQIFSNNKVYFVNRFYMKLQSLISFVLTIFNTLMIIMKLLFGNLIDKNYYEDFVNRFINLDTKEIKLQLITENPQIRYRTMQNHNDKLSLQNLNERKLDKCDKQDIIIISENKMVVEENLR